MGSIITFDDLVREGIEASNYDRNRVERLITLAEQAVEKTTGRLFRLVEGHTMLVDGNDRDELLLRHPFQLIDSVTVDGETLETAAYALEDDPIVSHRLLTPKLLRIDGYTWPRGRRNVAIVGNIGHVISDGGDPPKYSAPEDVKRLAVLMVIEVIEPLSSKIGSVDESRIKREKKGNYEYELFDDLSGRASEDSEIGKILRGYQRIGIAKI